MLLKRNKIFIPIFDEYEALEKDYKNPKSLMYKKIHLVNRTIPGGQALLDFGCGQGVLLSKVIGRFHSVTGIDITDKALELTRSKLGSKANARLYLYKYSMPKVEGNFDWVTCLDVLEHLEKPDTVLKKIHSLMADTGNLIITVPNWYDIINLKFLRRSKYHIHAHTPWGWMAIIRRAGFKIKDYRSVKFPFICSNFLAKRLYFLGMCVFIWSEKV